jgi:hypothetical protein
MMHSKHHLHVVNGNRFQYSDRDVVVWQRQRKLAVLRQEIIARPYHTWSQAIETSHTKRSESTYTAQQRGSERALTFHYMQTIGTIGAPPTTPPLHRNIGKEKGQRLFFAQASRDSYTYRKPMLSKPGISRRYLSSRCRACIQVPPRLTRA